MKKTLKIILFSCFVGASLACLFFFNIKDVADAKKREVLYIFQTGVFKSFDNATSFARNYEVSKLVHDQEYYRVFIGVTSKNQDLLKSIFDQAGYKYYIKEIEMNDEITKKIKKYDELLNNAKEESRMAVIKNMLESLPNEL